MAGSPVPTGLHELAMEDERIWTRVWTCVGVAQQIPASGDLLPATVGHHGLHVQRRPDGGLRAAFNVLQQGSCWTIPAQCGHGHKTKCPYVSCAHSLDTDALPAQDGAPTREMRQFIGFNSLKLADVPVQTAGPLIFVALAEPSPLPDQLGSLGVAARRESIGRLRHVARFWAELDCNWKLASDALFEALGAPPESERLEERLATGTAVPGTGTTHGELWSAGAAGAAWEPLGLDDGGGVQLWRAFPNAVLAALPNHAAAIVVKPTRLDGVTLVVSLFANHRGEIGRIDEAASALVAGWRAVTGVARARSRSARLTGRPPILADACARLASDGASAGLPSRT
jgi:hypothetical protein